MQKRIAYVVVIENRESEGAGHYLGLAREGEPGYFQLAPGFGPYKTWDAAEKDANMMNSKLGHTQKEAGRIILSTMRHGVTV